MKLLDKWLTRAAWVVLGAVYVWVMVRHDGNRKERERRTWKAAADGQD